MRKSIVLAALLSALCAAILFQAASLLQDEALATNMVDDFSQYWAAGRLNARGADPYSSSQVYELQLALQPHKDRPTLMWNPPWTLALAMPFGLMPYALARLLWFAIHLAIIIGSIVWLWKHGSGASPHWAWILALVIGFPPTVNALGEGQISPLILLGLVGFLHFESRGNHFIAGSCAALALIKPHLLLMFWIALLCRAIYCRSFTKLMGAATCIALLSAIALAFNPAAFHQYLAAVRQSPPFYWVPPTLGAILRMSFGWDKTWLSFLPSCVAAVWVAYYCHRHREVWQWQRHLSTILLVSVTVTAYGWIFDQIVFLVPVVYGSHWVAQQRGPIVKWVVGAYAVTCLYGFYVMAFNSSVVADYGPGVDTAQVRQLALGAPNSFWFVVVPPILLIAHHVVQRNSPRFPPARLSGGLATVS